MNSPAGHAPLPGFSSRRKSVSILDPDLNFVPGRGKHASDLGHTADAANGSVMLAEGASPHLRACDDDSLSKELKGQHTSVVSPPHSSATATAGAAAPQLPDPVHHHSTASKIFNICASLESAARAGQAATAPLAAAIKTVQDAVEECDIAELIASRPPPIALPPVPNTAADLSASLRTKVASAKAEGAPSGAFVDNSFAGNGAAAAAPAESSCTNARSISPPESVAVMQNEINRGLTRHGSDVDMRSTIAGPNITAPSSRSANIPVPVRHARAAVLCASTSPSDSALRSNFWTLLSGEQPPMALVHSFRSVIEPEISGRKRVWVRAQDADPLCYLSLIFSRANVPPIALFSAIDGSMQSDFMDGVYMSGIDVFLVPFDLDPFLGMAAADSDTSQTCALILSTLISLLQHIATLCVRHAANGDFAGPSILLAGMCSKDVIDSHISILRLVSDTLYDMLKQKGSFVSLGLIECALDASSCLWFHPISSSSPHGSFAIQDALCTYLYSPAGSSFTLPQHWFHLITSLRQNTQPAVPMSTVHSLAAECFALDVPSSNFEDELQRFLSFVAEQGVAWRSSSAPDLFVMDGPLLAWQTAAAVMHHGSTVMHPGQHAQSTSRRSHQQAYHSFLLTGHLSSVLLNSFFSSEAWANHALPILVARGLIVPLSSSEKSQPPGTSTSFAVLSMMPKVSSEKLQLQLGTSFAPCLSLICFIFTCDAPPRVANPSTVPSPSVFALRASPLHLIPSLWAELRSMVLDELKLGMDAIVMSSSLFACVAAAPFSIEHDSHNQFFRLRLHGVARDMLLSRISCCFSRAITVFPFISYNFSLDSSQFSSCATLPPVLFSLRKMIECAASGKAFHHSSASIAAEEVDLVLGNSYRASPWITVHVVYSTASLHFARAVCRDLSLSHVSGVDVHCLMVRAAPFLLPDTELIHVINEANHVIFFAEQQELVGALHSQPHSIFASQLLTLRHLLSQNPGLSFSSYVLRNSAHSPAAPSYCKAHSDTVDDSLASLLASSTALQSASVQGVHDVITRIFLSSEQLHTDTSALVSSSSLVPSQVSALSRAVLERLHLLSLLQPSFEDASIFQKEFSTVTLESDSAFHLMSSIELDVSAQSRTNASTTMSLPNHQSPAAAYANIDYGVDESSDNDDNGGYGTDDEYDNEDVGESGDDFADRSVPPRPPTPPDEDEVLELQSLILSLSAPLSARPAVNSAAAGVLLPVLDTSIHSQLPRAEKAALQHESPAPPPQAASKSNGVKFADEANLSIEFNSPSDPPKNAFLKKGSGSLRQKQRQIDGAIPRVNSSPKQPRASDFAPTVPTILSRSSISPVLSPSSSKSSPHVGISSPELHEPSRQASSTHPPTTRSPVSRAPATALHDPYPPDAHPRLTLLLPELCFDRSAGAANRVISSWLDHEGRISTNRSRAMRLVCLCEMHVARPQGPTSSPLILWHRCSHLGFPVAASKVSDAIRACAETSREVITMARLAGVCGRIFGSPQHDELLERNMAEWNHANLLLVQGDGADEAYAADIPALHPSTPASLSSASPYLSDVPVGISTSSLTRFAPSFSCDNTRLQYMRIANAGLKMFHSDMWLCPDHYELVDLFQKGQISAQLLISSSLAVEISKLPPFESAIMNSTPQPTRSHTHVSSLPWMQSPIISAIAATVSEPVQSNPRSRFRPVQLPTKYQRPASPANDSSVTVLSKNGKSATAHAAAGHDDEQVSVHRGCIPPQIREKCIMM